MKKKTYIEYKNGKIVRNKEHSKPDALFGDESLESTNEKINSTGADQRGEILNGENKNLNKGNTPNNQTPSQKQDGEDESSLKARNINEDINTHKEESKEENTEKNKKENKKHSNILNDTENIVAPEKTKKETKREMKELEKERERERILEEINESNQDKMKKNTVGSPYKSIISTKNKEDKKESTDTSDNLEKKEKMKKKKEKMIYYKKNTKEWIVSLLLWILIIGVSLFVLMFVYRAGENSNTQTQEPRVSIIQRVRDSAGGVRDSIVENRFVAPLLGNQNVGSTNSHMREFEFEDLSSFSSHTSSLLSSTDMEDISAGDVSRVVEEVRERKWERVIEFHEFKLTRAGLIQDFEKIEKIEEELIEISKSINLDTAFINQIRLDLEKTRTLLDKTKSFKSSGSLLGLVQ